MGVESLTLFLPLQDMKTVLGFLGQAGVVDSQGEVDSSRRHKNKTLFSFPTVPLMFNGELF